MVTDILFPYTAIDAAKKKEGKLVKAFIPYSSQHKAVHIKAASLASYTILTGELVVDCWGEGVWCPARGVAEQQAGLADATVAHHGAAQRLRLDALHVLSDGRDRPVGRAPATAGGAATAGRR